MTRGIFDPPDRVPSIGIDDVNIQIYLDHLRKEERCVYSTSHRTLAHLYVTYGKLTTCEALDRHFEEVKNNS